MPRDLRFVDAIRRRSSPLEAHLIDGLVAGPRRPARVPAPWLPCSACRSPLLGGITASLGMGGLIRAARAAAGGTLRVGQQVPAAAVEPVSVADGGGLAAPAAGRRVPDLVDGPDLVLRPQLAESWSPNQDGTVWTFKLRQGVKFHDGRTMTADDVVATFDRLADPANSLERAVGVQRAAVARAGRVSVDDYTVEFHLDVANGNFPYMVSSDNYNAIILPADYAGDFEKTFIGTGPFKLEKFTPKVGASFVRNDDYWGPKALLDRTEFTFFDRLSSRRSWRCRAGRSTSSTSCRSWRASACSTIRTSTSSRSSRRRTSRCTCAPTWTRSRTQRVRRAIALCLDRPRIVQGLMKGKAADRQRQPVRRRLPVDRPDRAAAREEHRRGQAAGRGRRPEARLQGHADHRALSGNPRLSRS